MKQKKKEYEAPKGRFFRIALEERIACACCKRPPQHHRNGIAEYCCPKQQSS